MCSGCRKKAQAAAASASVNNTPQASAAKVQISSSVIATPKAKAYREVGRPRVISNGIKRR